MNDTVSEAQENHDRFVRDVIYSGVVWGLKSDRGWAVCESAEYEDTEVYPFWSDEADARIHCTDDWADYVPATLDLDLFIDTWLAGMSEDGVLVGTNWDADLSGMEVEPGDLAGELLGENFQSDPDRDSGTSLNH
ncbi:MAG: DUF2750 domain-containing protein [Chromatiaceae bacterium]